MNPALAATLARIDAGTDYCTVLAGPAPDATWVGLRTVMDDPAVLRSWFALLRARVGYPSDVAGSFVAGWLADVVLHAITTALRTEQRSWHLDPDRTWLHRHDGGWFDGVSVDADVVRVLAGDPAASGDHETVDVVADLATLRRDVATDVVAVLHPLFATVRSMTPFGRRGMWGAAADGLASNSVHGALRAGEDGSNGFAVAMAFVDDLVAAGSGPITRPTPLSVECRRGEVTVVRRSTCCLLYKTVNERERNEGAYCTSCPLLTADCMRTRYVEWLDSPTI